MKSAAFRTITESPLNGAPAPDALVRDHVTAVGNFFVRNHGETDQRPETRDQSVSVTGLVRNPISLSSLVSGLWSRVALQATLQCAGNRRTALQQVRPIPGEVPWPSEAIGNAVWEGVPLSDVLARAGVMDGAAHVWFEGRDVLTGKHDGRTFGASIPVDKAMSGHVILADTMNGEPLTPEHGAPVRVVVPGYIGARSVKWLAAIRVEREPSPNHFQHAYSVYPPSVTAVPDDRSTGRVLGEFPLSCAFGSVRDGSTVADGRAKFRGWSIAGGERTVARVEVSTDGGATWTAARFLSAPQRFVWRLWEADVSLTPGAHVLVCRAHDDAGGTQPENPADVWNVKGYVNNSWDRVRVTAG